MIAEASDAKKYSTFLSSANGLNSVVEADRWTLPLTTAGDDKTPAGREKSAEEEKEVSRGGGQVTEYLRTLQAKGLGRDEMWAESIGMNIKSENDASYDADWCFSGTRKTDTF